MAAAIAVLLGVMSGICVRTPEKQVKEFTAFFAVQADMTTSADNRIKTKIAQITGAKADVEWLTGQTASESVTSMIQRGEYPDFINGSDATDQLIQAGALVPLEGYLDDYPYLKEYLNESRRTALYRSDGHIYYIPPFGVIQGKNTATINSGEAFWIQKRVLEWAGYPKLQTLDEYFEVIRDYLQAHPETDGEKNTGFAILCDDWRYFCLENPPMFLAGYPNDGCAIVDPVTQKASVYDTIPEAKQYYRKLSEMYDCGVIGPETFTLSFQQYLDKLSTGSVLGMVDQYWQFMTAQNNLYANGKEECTYVPFPITADEGIKGNYNCREENLNVADGIGISVDCEDVEGALQFLNDLLSPEVMVLRNWGEEGIDYGVDENGCFYRMAAQRAFWADDDYLKENVCSYPFFPAYEGMLSDGINTVHPSEQPGEYYDRLSDYDKKILDAYGYRTWGEFLGEEQEGEPWYPLYSCTADWPSDSAYGIAEKNMEMLKRRWLPRIIMSGEDEFERNWKLYMSNYEANVDRKAYEEQLNLEIQKRVQWTE